MNKIPLVAALALLGIGCGPGYQIIKQSTPNGLLNQKAFSVAEIDFSTMKIGNPAAITEEQWVAKKGSEKDKEDLRAKLLQSKVEMNAKFAGRLAGAGASHGWQVAVGVQPSTLVIKANVVQFEPGIWIPFPQYSTPAILRIGIQVTDAQGAVLDEIEARAVISADAAHPEMVGRVATAAEEIANRLLEYLTLRVAGTAPEKK